MGGKNDEGCGDAEGGLKDEVAPMRHFGGAGPAGYATGPSHVDRADFRENADAAEATTEATDAAPTEPKDPPEGEAPAT